MNLSMTNQTWNACCNNSNGADIDVGRSSSAGNGTDLVSLAVGWVDLSISSTIQPLNTSLNATGNGTGFDPLGPGVVKGSDILQVTWGVLAILSGLIGLHTNVVMLSVIVHEIRANLWVSTNSLLINLCALDTCICIVLLCDGILMVDQYETIWPHCPTFCRQLAVISFTLVPMRQLVALILAISHHVMCTQNEGRFTTWCARSRLMPLVISIWVLGMLTIIVGGFKTPDEDSITQGYSTCHTEFLYRLCYLRQDGKAPAGAGAGKTIFFLCNAMPVVIIAILSVVTHRKLKHIYGNIEQELTPEVPVRFQIAEQVLVRIAIWYCILSLPRAGWQICDLMAIPMPPVLNLVFRFTQHFASVINPILYGKEKALFIKRYCLLPDGSVMDIPYN